jgi:hypothetical protein
MKSARLVSVIMAASFAGGGAGCVASDEPEVETLDSSAESAISSEAEVAQPRALEALSRAPGDEVTPFACRWVYAQAGSYDSWYGVWYTSSMSTSSACGHIYVQDYTSGCVSARIRYYPSTGGSFTSGAFQSVCNGSWTAFSTNVLAGTVFRVETTTASAQFALDI